MSLYTNNTAQFYVLSVRRENQHPEISNFVTISQACGFCSMVQFKSTISVLNLRGSDLYDLKILWGNAKILFFRFFRVKSNKVTTFHLNTLFPLSTDKENPTWKNFRIFGSQNSCISYKNEWSFALPQILSNKTHRYLKIKLKHHLVYILNAPVI
jgi:hypothetical protein